MDAQRRSEGVVNTPDPLFDKTARYSALDGLDHLAAAMGVMLTLMVGVDVYRWLAFGRPMEIRMLWLLPAAMTYWRRAIVGEEAARTLPASWSWGMGAYFLIVLAIELNRKPATWSDWAVVVMTAFFVVLAFLKAARR